MNRSYSILLISLLFATNWAAGKSSLIEVTPKKSKIAGFKLKLTAKELPDNRVEFRAVITEKEGKFSSMPKTAVSVVTVTKTSTSRTERVSPKREIDHERKDNTLTCVFTVSTEELKNANLCFTLSNQAETVVDGRIRQHPSMLILYARLAAFAKPAAEDIETQ